MSFSFTDNQLVMSYGSVELVTRLLEGSKFHNMGYHPKDDLYTKAVFAHAR